MEELTGMVAVRAAHHRKIHVVVAHPSLTLHTPPQLHTHTHTHCTPDLTQYTHISTRTVRKIRKVYGGSHWKDDH